MAKQILTEKAMVLMGKHRLTPDENTLLYAWSQVIAGKLTPNEAFNTLRDLRIL